MKMKRIISTALASAMLLSTGIVAHATDPEPRIDLSGQLYVWDDVENYLVTYETYLNDNDLDGLPHGESFYLLVVDGAGVKSPGALDSDDMKRVNVYADWEIGDSYIVDEDIVKKKAKDVIVESNTVSVANTNAQVTLSGLPSAFSGLTQVYYFNNSGNGYTDAQYNTFLSTAKASAIDLLAAQSGFEAAALAYKGVTSITPAYSYTTGGKTYYYVSATELMTAQSITSGSTGYRATADGEIFAEKLDAIDELPIAPLTPVTTPIYLHEGVIYDEGDLDILLEGEIPYTDEFDLREGIKGSIGAQVGTAGDYLLMDTGLPESLTKITTGLVYNDALLPATVAEATEGQYLYVKASGDTIIPDEATVISAAGVTFDEATHIAVEAGTYVDTDTLTYYSAVEDIAAQIAVDSTLKFYKDTSDFVYNSQDTSVTIATLNADDYVEGKLVTTSEELENLVDEAVRDDAAETDANRNTVKAAALKTDGYTDDTTYYTTAAVDAMLTAVPTYYTIGGTNYEALTDITGVTATTTPVVINSDKTAAGTTAETVTAVIAELKGLSSLTASTVKTTPPSSRAITSSDIILSGTDYYYFVEVETKEYTGANEHDVLGEVSVGTSKSKAEDYEVEIDLVLTEGEFDGGAEQDGDVDIYPNSPSVVRFSDYADDIAIFFGDDAMFYVDAGGQDELNLAYNTDYNRDIANKYGFANIDFINFVDQPTFNRNGDMFIYAEKDMFIYELVDGEVQEISGLSYDNDEDAWEFRTKVLGTYLISDEELPVGEDFVEPEAETDTSTPPTYVGKPNPGTGR